MLAAVVENLSPQDFQPIPPPPSYSPVPPPPPPPGPSYKQFWNYFPLGRVTPLNIETGIRTASEDVDVDGDFS